MAGITEAVEVLKTFELWAIEVGAIASGNTEEGRLKGFGGPASKATAIMIVYELRTRPDEAPCHVVDVDEVRLDVLCVEVL